MAGDTKKKILETALELFAQNGYLGTSMNDIAEKLGITKGALYKHYASKQEILDSIVERMNEADFQRATRYEMPETETDNYAEAYSHVPIEKIRSYSIAQFDHWTKEYFSANFRKMLTLEQYREPKFTQLYQNYLVSGPVMYMTEIFKKLTGLDAAASEQLALEFYGPLFLLYGIYDGADDKDRIVSMVYAHIDNFIEKIEFKYK
ncbi:MAG: helix-turn-helix domain-containing protein [Erysipelotrichia bacterium]|nr:helix-turn-helix domain-containing protein [Erysipelotrichia bacterium]